MRLTLRAAFALLALASLLGGCRAESKASAEVLQAEHR